MAQPAPQGVPPPQYAPPSPPVQYAQPPPAPPKKSNSALIVVVAVVVVIVVVLVGLWAAGVFNPSSSSGGGSSGSAPASHTENIVNTQNQQFGPTFTNAGAYGFTVPSNALGAWVNGTFSVTTCTSIGDYCL